MATYTGTTGTESDKDKENKGGFAGSMSGGVSGQAGVSGRGMDYEQQGQTGIERRAKTIASDPFMWAAGVSILGSLAFQIFGMRREQKGLTGGVSSLLHPREASATRAPLASFVGMWVPSLLMLGVYNKIVKVIGPERGSERSSR